MKSILFSSATALALTLGASVQAQNTANPVRTDPAQSAIIGNDATRSVDRLPASTSTLDHSMPVSKANKASSLIGMEVRNPQNEKLGEIKDLVVDLHTGKIIYAVLSVGGFLGIGDKYVAVPPNAFNIGTDQDRLVLNADKAKVQNAPAFAKDNWPDAAAANWTADSNYWLNDGTAQGTSGAIRSGTGSTTSGNPVPPLDHKP